MKKQVEAIVEAVRERRLVVLCGAGVSMLAPSRSPSWWEIYSAAARSLADRLRDHFPSVSEELDVDALLAPLTTQELADLVSSFAGPTFSELLTVVDVADPNENHRAIASLAALSGLRAVLTTNFDTLIERAASARGVSMTIAAPGLLASRRPNDACVLIKIHGTTVDTGNIIETSTHKAKEVSPILKAAWSGKLDGADLLVLGYSGADLNFGAVRGFFSDFLVQGGRIYWLHRCGSEPKLPNWVEQRVTLIEGSLPFPLRAMLAELGASDFETPHHGRDAQASLARAMDNWSRELHIGHWAAATFYLALCERSGPACSRMRDALLQLAREHVPRFGPGSSFDVSDIGAGVFFAEAGMTALQALALEDAEAIQRAAVNIFTALDQRLAGAKKLAETEKSYVERQGNLASAWNNLGHIQVLKGEINLGISCFSRGLDHAYFAGAPSSFLNALLNILHYGFELREILRCMGLAEAAIRLADRFGAVLPSIELRLLLAMYAFDRNELWTAADWLNEAQRRALALNDENKAAIAELLLGENHIRSGRVEKGLSRIAKALVARSKTAFLFRPIEELRRLLAILGIEHPVPFMVTLATDDIPRHVEAIDTERREARERKDLPWEGAHCRVSTSATVGDDARRALFQLGVFEFEGQSESAIQLGLLYAETMLSNGRHVEAHWAARNVLLRPDLKIADRARAHTALAQSAAALGFLEDTRQHLEAAVDGFSEGGLALPPMLTRTGLWFFVQCGDSKTACLWAERRVAACRANSSLISDLSSDAQQLQTWGDPMAEVARTIRRGLAQLGVSAQQSTPPETNKPFRPFSGTTVLSLPSDESVSRVLHEAELALRNNDTAGALAALDSLAEKGQLPEQQAAVAVALQVHALAPSLSQEKIEAFTDYHRRRLLGSLAFTALSRLETSLLWALVRQHRDLPKVASLLAARGWIGEMADDPIARASLLTWEALQPALAGQQILHNKRTRSALQTAWYFGLPEQGLTDLDSAMARDQSGDSTARDLVTMTLSTLRQAYADAADSADADSALVEAVRVLRRARCLDQETLARMRVDRAGWALQNHHFAEAQALYQRVYRSFKVLGLVDDALNAKAGEARSYSRAGNHTRAVEIFTEAIEEAENRPIRINLLQGLGSAHLLEGTERRDPPDLALIDKAIEIFRRAVHSTSIGSLERPFAKLALARALGEKGEQLTALDMFDRAVAELAHLGDPRTKLLQENRNRLAEGQWRILALS